MSFTRNLATHWHEEVPGARWFKADLHIHTIDDHPSKRAKMPEGVNGSPDDPVVIHAYARKFLHEAWSRGIQVIGLTPHSPRAGSSPETSAVWAIVEEWNNGVDDDGTPFYEKIYAVFPGFEPSLKEGHEGLHLIFLFDPEVGRDRYLRLFDLVMGGVSPWNDNILQISNKSASEVFEELHRLHDRETQQKASDMQSWSYIVLAPHIEASKGLLGAQKAQVLQLFNHAEVAGLELPDTKLPEDVLQNRPWLRDGMTKYRQSFLHGSDAYRVDDIGRCYTWIKLANPRIEALRQAFLASSSRMRIAFERGEDGSRREIADPSDTMRRPWLKRVTIRGGASFFGGEDGNLPRETSFDLSPDFTCIIGGSMTGKSTFLDGLRVYVGAPLPHDELIKKQVEARGNLFSAGSPDIELECPGRDPTAPLHEQWPAQFFSQNELQRLSQERGAIEDILARLVPAETPEIKRRKDKLSELDRELEKVAQSLAEIDDEVSETEQIYDRAHAAKKALNAFTEAGVERLHRIGHHRQVWGESVNAAGKIQEKVAEAARLAREFKIPSLPKEITKELKAKGLESEVVDLDDDCWGEIHAQLNVAVHKLQTWIDKHRIIANRLIAYEQDVQTEVERALAERGYDAAKLQEFKGLSKQAAQLPNYADKLKKARKKRDQTEKEFKRLQVNRALLLRQQRRAFCRVIAVIEREFGARIRARRIPEGDPSPLDGFIRKLNQRGITRWWNETKEHWEEINPRESPTPRRLSRYLENNWLEKLGMSEAVQQTFQENMTRARRYELLALRLPDVYVLEMRMDDGSYRRLGELSGGQRVSVLLSLLLETTDERPLIIDQPEDELANEFLWETVLPALKRLKGRRQVIVATHNANIVVNGDADLVIQLEATAHQGRIACSGAIEEPRVREAILRTVDGGAEAFRLRLQKYGF